MRELFEGAAAWLQEKCPWGPPKRYALFYATGRCAGTFRYWDYAQDAYLVLGCKRLIDLETGKECQRES